MSSQELVSIQNRLRHIATKVGQPLALPETVALPARRHQKAIAVCGMLGRGKSSLINAIITNDLLPVNIPPNLSALSCYHISVTNASPPFIKAHLSSGIVEDVGAKAINTAQLATWGSKLQWIEIQASFPNLAKGFKLIETPSLGSVDFNSRTQSILEQVSNVVLVIDANLNLSDLENEFLKSLPGNIRNIIIAANKIDAASPENHSVYMRRIVEQLNTLGLNPYIDVDVFKISVQAVAEHSESNDWLKLKAKLANLAQSSIEIINSDTASVSSQATWLLKAAENLQATLKAKRLSAGTTTPNDISAKKIDDLGQTKKLIQDVIDDQARDILKTVRNSLEAITFQLESDIRANRKDPQSVKRDLQNWLGREQKRMKERLERHFRSILDDTNYAVGKTYTLNVELDEIRVNAVQEVNVQSPAKFLIPEYLRLSSIGAGAITTIASLLFFSGRLLISLTVGGTVTAFAWLVADNLLMSSRRDVKLPDLSSAIMPEFERNVHRNTGRLSALVKDAFNEALANAQTSSAELASPHDNSIRDELINIIAELKGMLK